MSTALVETFAFHNLQFGGKKSSVGSPITHSPTSPRGGLHLDLLVPPGLREIPLPLPHLAQVGLVFVCSIHYCADALVRQQLAPLASQHHASEYCRLKFGPQGMLLFPISMPLQIFDSASSRPRSPGSIRSSLRAMPCVRAASACAAGEAHSGVVSLW